MGCRASFCVLSLLIFLLLPALAPAQQVYMDLTFDDQPLDTPLGTGGTAAGQATWIGDGLVLTVRSTPFATPSLEVHNSDLVNSKNFGFEPPGGPVSSGLVVVDMDLWIQAVGEGWDWWMILMNSSFGTMTKLKLETSGELTLADGGGIVASVTPPLGRPLPVRWAFSLDEGTYSAWIDGTQVLTDRALTVSTPSVRRFNFVCGWAADPVNRFWIDRILVKDTLEDVAVDRATWGRIKRLYGA